MLQQTRTWKGIRAYMIAAMLGSLPALGIAQAGSPWLAAADPFQKFVHDIFDFSKYLIDRRDRLTATQVSQSVPDLVKSMRQVAANKRALATAIEMAINNQDANAFTNLSNLTRELDQSVRHLVALIKGLDSNWVAGHGDLTKEVDDMEFEKASVAREALSYYSNKTGGVINLTPDESKKFAARLRDLASELDSDASKIEVSIRGHAP